MAALSVSSRPVCCTTTAGSAQTRRCTPKVSALQAPDGNDVCFLFAPGYCAYDFSAASQKDPVHWTYRSNQLLYPILDIPQTKKQIVKEMGLEHEIEIEIVVPHERKRLFTFPSATAKA